jgi:hypothetical protein
MSMKNALPSLNQRIKIEPVDSLKLLSDRKVSSEDKRSTLSRLKMNLKL